MAVTVTKRRGAHVEEAAAPAALTGSQVREKVDRMAEIEAREGQVRAAIAKKVEKESAELARLADESAVLRGELMAHACAGLGELETAALLGTAHVVEVGKCKKVTEVVDKEKARRFLERAMKGAFMELVQVPVGKLREYLTKPQLEQVLKETHDGPRSFSLKTRKQPKR